MSDLKNQLQLEIKDYDLFVRKQDGFSVPYDTLVNAILP